MEIFERIIGAIVFIFTDPASLQRIWEAAVGGFISGAVIAIPLFFVARYKHKKKKQQEQEEAEKEAKRKEYESLTEEERLEIQKNKMAAYKKRLEEEKRQDEEKRFFKRRKK